MFSLKMAATWRLLPTVKFWSSKLEKEIPCNQLLCDFGRLLEDKDEPFFQGVGSKCSLYESSREGLHSFCSFQK